MKKNNKTKNLIKGRNRYFSTQGYKKLWNYFIAITKTEQFNDFVLKMRDEYRVPKNGFSGKEMIIPPKQWHYGDKNNIRKKLNKDLEGFCTGYSLHYMDWGEIIELFIFYNKIIPTDYINSYNLCLVTDLKEIKESKENGNVFRRSDDLAYPIMIRISPYATKRDIIDYVQKVYRLEIMPSQEQYKKQHIKIGKIKTKDILKQKRNDFIYKHRNKPIKEIVELLYDKFNILLDEGHIGKIISLERKRRQKL